MPLYTQSIKNLKGGISQQPDTLRFSDQGESQVNCWSSESEGLQKRPPLVNVRRLAGYHELGPNPLIHLINRDEQEKYFMVFTGTGLRVFGLDGVEYPTAGDMSYLSSATPRDEIRVVTVADYTFVVHRGWTALPGGAEAHPEWRPDAEGIVNVRGGQYGRTLKVFINGTQRAVLDLPKGTDGDDYKQVDAQYIAKTLGDQLIAALPNWHFTVGSGYIHVKAPDNENLTTLETEDGYANQLINPVKFQVQTFAKLPLNAPDGYLVEIKGDPQSTADAYYVRYNAAEKVWAETVGPGVRSDLIPGSMPHAIVRRADGVFELQELPWGKRTSGDEDTNPWPSFIDSQINDVFFYRNRLGFLSGENIIMSRPGKYFDFFPASVATISDDDPIDVAISHNRISILKYAVPFSEEMLLWSDQAQFVLSANGVLSAKTIQLDLTTQFDVTDAARPFNIGRNVFFCAPRGSFSSIKRYFAVADVSAVKDAIDTTGHVLSYIPNGVFSLGGSGTENFLSVLTTGAPNKVFMYKFLFDEGQQLQASWSHWEVPTGSSVLAAHTIGSKTTFVVENSSGIWMLYSQFIKETTDLIDEPYRLHMDWKKAYFIPAGRFDINSYTTSFWANEVFGAAPPDGTYYTVKTDGSFTEHVVTADSGRVSIDGNVENSWVFFGMKYQMEYTFSKFLIKHEDGNSSQTEDTGRLQLRRAWVNYSDTGELKLTVSNRARDFTYQLTGETLGQTIVGGSMISDGQYRFPMNGDATQTTLKMTSEAPTPAAVIGCGWEASYMKKARSI